MKILITGAAGFVGSHLVQALASNHEVFALARYSSALTNVQWIQCDLSLPLNLDTLPAKIDAVFHLAQSRHYREFPEKAEDIYSVNIQVTFAMLEYARRAGAERFIFTSSGGIYGYNDEQFAESDSAAADINFYLMSKYAGELLVSTYRSFFHTIVCRPFFIYGARQNPTMLIPRLAHSIQNGTPITLQGQDGIRINPIYVEDAVEALVRTLNLDGDHIINLAGAEILSLRDIVVILSHLIGREPVLTLQKDQQPKHLVGDITKMRSLLIEPKTSFSDGAVHVIRELLVSSTRPE